MNAFLGRLAIVSLIILSWNIPTFCGEIHDAAKAGDAAKAKALLKNHPELVSSKDNDGWLPLHWAVEKGNREVAELLLANKADIHAKIIRSIYLSIPSGSKNSPFRGRLDAFASGRRSRLQGHCGIATGT